MTTPPEQPAADAPEQLAADAPEQLAADAPDVVREVPGVARALRVAVLVLAVPALLLAALVLLPVGAVIGIAGAALVLDGLAVLPAVALALGLAALALVVSFVVRVLRYRRAVASPADLADEIRRLFDVDAITQTTLEHLVELSSFEGGLRPVRRARALWRVLRTADTVEDHITSHERARWFVPPDVTLTWAMTQAVVVTGVVALVAVPALAAALALGM